MRYGQRFGALEPGSTVSGVLWRKIQEHLSHLWHYVTLEFSQLGTEEMTGLCVRQASCCPKMILAYGRSSRHKHTMKGPLLSHLFYSAILTKHKHAQKACHHTSISRPHQPLLAQTRASVCMPVSCVSEAVRTL